MTILYSFVLAVLLLLSAPAAHADFSGGFDLGFRKLPERPVPVDLHAREPQAISHGLAFKVEEASVKDRQLWVIGEVINNSNTTYTQVRMDVEVEDGADLRLTLGKLAPGASRRVQARLATEYEHAPREILITVGETKTDYRPKPYRW